MVSQLHIQLLDKALHDRSSFDCGVDALNEFLAKQARREQESGCCVCFVATEMADSKRIIGYYTLSSASIARTALEERLIKKLPRYKDLPATLLGRLAVDKDFQGQRLGGRLLVSAMNRAYQASQEIASWALVADPKDSSARSFYRKFGFLELGKERMFLPMKQVASFINAL